MNENFSFNFEFWNIIDNEFERLPKKISYFVMRVKEK